MVFLYETHTHNMVCILIKITKLVLCTTAKYCMLKLQKLNYFSYVAVSHAKNPSITMMGVQ